MEKYKIIHYTKGKYGYKTFYQLVKWNSVYEHYYSLKDAIMMEFIRDYFILHPIEFEGINFDSIPVEKV